MEAYAIGLDIGIASVGWATVALDQNENPCAIIGMGSRIFDKAEHPKTGASLAAPRREARSARRRLRRHRHRNERIRALLIRNGLVTQAQLDSLFAGKLEDIYALRVRALDEVVSPEALCRILIHLSQRRGFRSNRKNGVGEDGVLLKAVAENKQRMEQKGYRTVGEMLYKDPLYKDHKRNKGGSYLATVSRDAVEQEARAIFDAQQRLGNPVAQTELLNAYLDILLSQRSFDDGPGGDSPYGGDLIANRIGKCQFEEEKRAAKATYSFEYFTLLEKLNHIRLIRDGKSQPLDMQQRNALITLALKSPDLNYAKLRKALALPEDTRFNMVRYGQELSFSDAEKKEKFVHMRQYHKLKKAFGPAFDLLSTQKKDAIAEALTRYHTTEKIHLYLASYGFSQAETDVIDTVGSFSGYGHLSAKACGKLIPHLEQGMNYNDACAAAGYDFKGHSGCQKDILLHPTEQDYESITSPVVKRAVSQTIKVVNAIIRKQGCSPMYINVELARELAKDLDERRKIEKEMQQNRAANEALMEELRTVYGLRNPTGQDLVKLKLFRQQDGVCAYSVRQMSAQRLFEPNYAEIDHIIPYSISFDDSYKNKVLVLTEENRNKGNRLPLQYLTGKRREDFIVWTNSHVKDFRKRQHLLKEQITPEDEAQFIERNLQDTKTASRFMLNYLNDRLLFAPSACGRVKRVTAVSGAATSHMRKRWGVNKVRADGDLHHAVDALVIACTTDAMIRQVSRYSRWRECRYAQMDGVSLLEDTRTGEVLKEFPHPWPQFHKELTARLSSDPVRAVLDSKLPYYVHSEDPLQLKPLFVSRMPQRKVTGAAHKDTVRSGVMLRDGCTVSKQPLTALKLDKDGQIAGYYAPESDRLLYEALRQRLLAFGGDAKKAFAQPFFKPKNDGTPGPEVRKVKLYEKAGMVVPVHGGKGFADHENLIRVDVFRVEDDGYYFIPIYVADTLRPELPDRACIAGKPYAEWKVMQPEDFVFSLYPNDLIRVTHRSGMKLQRVHEESTLEKTRETKTAMLYYRGANRFTGAFSVITHDNAYKLDGLGIKTLVHLEKYTVDILGEYHPVRKEHRESFRR